jgi:YbbR domain-containing protein
MKTIRKIINNLPTILTALVFAVAVWVFAVTASDPTESRTYPRALELDVIGLDPNLMIVNDITQQVTLTIRAPSTILDQLENDSNLINITLDLSGLDAGVHTLTPQVAISLSPAEVIRINPSTVFVKLDSVITENFPIQVKQIGSPAIGFELETPELSTEQASISGPQSMIESIDEVIAEIIIENVSEDIQRTVDLSAYDSEGNQIEGITINPSSIQVNIPVVQRGGYRSVVVKIVTSGQISPGYRLTNIYALPPTVTIFSTEPSLIENIPGFVETTPINLNGASEDMEIRVTLNLPEGINVVGSQNVTVQIGIDPIQSSLSYSDIPIRFEGLSADSKATVSPKTVDVFLSGPLSSLEELDPSNIIVVINLSERGPGTYQLTPEVLLENSELNVDAIIPNTLEVTITNSGQTSNATPAVTPTQTP